jgi:hypothetical protein
MTIRSTFTCLAAALAAGMVLSLAIGGAQARGDGGHDGASSHFLNSIHPIAYHGPMVPDHRGFLPGPGSGLDGIKAPIGGTNAPVSDPDVRVHNGPNGQGGVTVTSTPRPPNPCSGIAYTCLEELRDHRSDWKGPSGSIVNDHRNYINWH